MSEAQATPRNFGYTFAVLWLLLAAFGWWRAASWWYWPLLPAALFAAAASFAPERLQSLNRAWFHFGLLLARIFNPLIMGLVFFLFLTPMGLLKRRGLRKQLGLRFEPALDSYWTRREPSGPDPQSFERQF